MTPIYAGRDIILEMRTSGFAFSFLICSAFGQSSLPSDVFRIGPGVTAPVPITKPEPRYSPEALAAEIHGAVMFHLVVNEQGQATNINVVNPLGFGLDEMGLEAIKMWRFQPGIKDGKAVKVSAVLEIHFGLKGRLSLEKRRNELILALQHLQNDPKEKERALKTIQDLAQKKLPAAMYEYGQLLAAGKALPADSARSRDLIAKAAEAKYGPAIFALASTSIEQKQGPQDLKDTKASIFNAAGLGSSDAQYLLASAYEKGNPNLGFQQDEERSLHYYRLCAAAGNMQCQFRLGETLLNDRSRGQDDIVEAIAWLELSTDQGETRARALGSRERANLSPQQITRVMGLKQKLVHRDQ